MKKMLSPARLALVLAGAALVAGCSGGKNVTLAPVSGTVTVGGQPVTGGQVSLIPFEKEQETSGLSAGTIDSGGKFTIYTGGKPGAPLGKYKVTVTMPMVPPPGGSDKPPPPPFNAKYASVSTTNLTFEVIESPAA